MTNSKQFIVGVGSFIGLALMFVLLSFQTSARETGGFTWQIDVIDSANFVGQFPSLALHPGTEKPYISYYDLTTKDLKLAFPVPSGGDCGPGNTWSCNSLAFQNTVDFGGFSSIAFNSSGQWGIVYSDFSSGANAFRGIPAPGATELFWTPIEAPGSSAFLNSSDLDLNERTHVSYGFIDFDTSDGFIKHAEYVGFGGNCGGGVWRCDTIIETSLLGFSLYNSLFFIYNLPNIAYRDINLNLSVATYIGTGGGNCGPSNSWICWVLDDTSSVNGLISTYARDPDYLGITYISGNNTLRYAEYVGEGGNCGSDLFENDFQCVTIEAVGLPALGQVLGASVGLSNNSPVIAYNDTNDQGHSILKIAYRKFAGNCGPLIGFFRTWQCEVVDDGGGVNDVGYYPSLDVDANGIVHIAYFDFTVGDLKYAVSEIPVGPTPTLTPTSTSTPTATPPPGTLIPYVYLPLVVR